ncbi:unnamed protein product [Symbiodinium sp. KB8]|nr:unnamed protein product [Symbiodinium sp. KB8]
METKTREQVALVAGGAVIGGLLAAAATQFFSAASAKGGVEGAKGTESADAEMSTTSSAHSGAVYETSTAVSEYLQFHYGKPEDIMPYTLCTEQCKKLGVPMGRALDVGCAVGATSFELSKDFEEVVGVDFSHAFVAAANSMKGGSATYAATTEGEVKGTFTASLESGVKPGAVTFEQGDACALRPDIGKFSVVHGANLLCRLPNPAAFLDRLKDIVVEGGLVVLVSPYSWLPAYTAKDKWLGGFNAADGKPADSFEGLTAALQGHFDLVHTENMPFLIREHLRKFQWGCSHATVWQRKASAGAAQA